MDDNKVTSLEGLTRYDAIKSGSGGEYVKFGVSSEGRYVKVADVERLLATMAAAAGNTQAQAATPATDDEMITAAVAASNVYGVLHNSASTMSIGRAVLAAERRRAAAVEPVAIPAGWIKESVKELAEKIADKVAKNADTVPNLTFPHIYMGLCEALLASVPAAPTPAASPASPVVASNQGEQA